MEGISRHESLTSRPGNTSKRANLNFRQAVAHIKSYEDTKDLFSTFPILVNRQIEGCGVEKYGFWEDADKETFMLICKRDFFAFGLLRCW